MLSVVGGGFRSTGFHAGMTHTPPHLPTSGDNPARESEFVTHLTASHRRLLGYLMSLLGRIQDAEDVLQKASLTMWKRFDQFETGTDFQAWAATICFYEAKNFQRMMARSRLRLDDRLLELLAQERLLDLDHQQERLAALEKCLGQLRTEDRSLLQAVYIDRAGVAELARRINRAPQTLYNKLNILRRGLAACVERRLVAG